MNLDSKQYRYEIKELILEQSKALDTLAQSIPETVVKIIELILNTNGNVVFCGIGKSGHIAQKISATFASTGTPSFFLHAAEANHGDLGRIKQSDLVILLSNSGNTEELKNTLLYTKRFSIKTVAITSNSDSFLAKNSTDKIILPNVPEICANNQAPTTSTTLALVFCDALAVAVMKQRKFSKENFKLLHPGGSLGKKVVIVSQLLRDIDEIPLVNENMKFSDVVIKMTETGFGIAIVVNEENRIIGVVTDGDIRRNLHVMTSAYVKDCYSRNPKTIQRDCLIEEALGLMQSHKVYSLIVAENRKPIGIIRLHDIMKSGLA